MSAPFMFRTQVKKALADTITPVSLYLRIRDQYPKSFLLESADFQPHQQCFSYICCQPIAEFRVQNEKIISSYPNQERFQKKIEARHDVLDAFSEFCAQFHMEETSTPFLSNGFFGYMAYDCIRYFDELNVQQDADESRVIPDMVYNVFKYIIAIDHYRNELFVMENLLHTEKEGTDLNAMINWIQHKDFPRYAFSTLGEETSNFTDEEYHQVIEACKKHVFQGDVFQIVPSRRFSRSFQGDEFNVYRALRSINPSPYLFYYDFGTFKLMGSSPEAQLIVEEGKASLFPIAGTYKRTGDVDEDMSAVRALRDDPKENAEHVMLVDLARNDLSKHCDQVHVDIYKQIQLFSHVIHLTSKVSGTLQPGASAIQLLGDTFPMGTLSGAPKYRALELIDQFEKGRRRAYGGAIGCLGFDGSCNHAIIIRSFLSKGSVLHYQAGGGVVADSVPAHEIQEIKNKLGALQAALLLAQEL